MKKIFASFFRSDAVDVAQELVGCVMEYRGCSGRIVETEAYKADPASHARNRTPRSRIMYETYGKLYVYFIYGMYYCLNITTNPPGEPGAVLIRALEPVSGIKKMKRRRKRSDVRELCSGPAKTCMALDITREQNGLEVGKGFMVFRTGRKPVVCSSPRIGIKHGKNLLWRFFEQDNLFVSKPR